MSHGRIAVYTVNPELIGPVLEKGKAELPGLVASHPGLVRYGVFQPTPDRVLSLSAWDTRAQAEAAMETLMAWVRANAAAAFVSGENYVGEIVHTESASEEPATHGRVAIYRFKDGTADAVVEKARSGFAPILRQQPGFVRYSLIKVDDAVGVSYSGWRSRAQAEQATAVAAAWVKENVADALVSVENHVGDLLWSARG